MMQYNRTPRVWRLGATVAIVLAALAAALASSGAADAANSLTIKQKSGDWSVTSGEADASVGKVAASGIRKNRIRYSGGGDGFSVNSRSGKVSYDGTPISTDRVELTITARDRRGRVASAVITVTVTVRQPAVEPRPEPATESTLRRGAIPPPQGQIANTPPTFPSGPIVRSVPENSAAGTGVGAAVAATDAEDGSLTYSLGGTDATSFDIVTTSGQLQTKAALDYEIKSSYSVTVTATDSSMGSASTDVTISVTDVDEQPATPDAPTVATTAGSASRLDVTWSAPGVNGGPALTGYELRFRKGASGAWINRPNNVSGTSVTIGSLDDSTNYEVQVRALNGETPSEWSPSGSGSTGKALEAISITSSPNSGNAYSAGETIEVTVTFSEAMTVTSEEVTYERKRLVTDNEEGSPATFADETVTIVTHAPSLELDIGGSRRLAGYASGSNSKKIVFQYTVLDGDRDDDGISIPGNPILLSGKASIQNADGVDVGNSHPGMGNQGGHKVAAAILGGAAPKIKGISISSTPASGDTYGAGEQILVVVTWDQMVNGLNEPYPTLKLTVGGNTRTALMAIHSGDKSKFRYVVQAGDTDGDGVSVPANPLTVPDGSFIRNTNNDKDAVLTYAAGLSAQSAHKVDGSADNVRPSQPTDLSATGHANADEEVWVSLIWRHSLDGTITKYQYQLDSGAWTDMTPFDGAGMSSYRIRGLTNRADYMVKIRAHDTGGAGDESAGVAVTWTTRPFEPKGLTVTSGNGQATVTWNDPHDGSITKYQYQLRKSLYRLTDEDGNPAVDEDGYPTWGYDYYGPWADLPAGVVSTRSHTFMGLDNGTHYRLRIRALNGDGHGPASYDMEAAPVVPE